MDFIPTILNSVASAFQKGGVMMYVILGFSIYAVAIFFERWFLYKKIAESSASERNGITSLLDEKKADGKTPYRKIIAAALSGKERGKEELEDKIRTAFLDESAEIEKNLNTIAVVASLLPMLGLLGTVVGMVTAFDSIAEFGTGDPKIVAGGISQALLTTEAGLIASIPLTFLHNLLSDKADLLTRNLDEFASLVLHAVRRKEE